MPVNTYSQNGLLIFSTSMYLAPRAPASLSAPCFTWFWFAMWCWKVRLMWHNYFTFVEKSRQASKAAPPFEKWRQKYPSKQGTFCYLRMLSNGWNLICCCHLTPTCNVSSLCQRGWSMGFILQLGNENNRENNQWATRENNRTAVSRFTANVWRYAWQECEGAVQFKYQEKNCSSWYKCEILFKEKAKGLHV